MTGPLPTRRPIPTFNSASRAGPSPSVDRRHRRLDFRSITPGGSLPVLSYSHSSPVSTDAASAAE